MRMNRRTRREVLRDKSGISTSIPEALGSVSIKAVVVTVIGGMLAGGLAFWFASTASANTSSSFQNASVLFEKAVHGSDVIIGAGTDRIGILTDVDGGRCEVQTWQGGSRDEATTLQIDTKVVDGVCAPTTPLLEAGSTASGRELVFNVEAPVFTYANLGGREVSYDENSVPTLVTGSRPAETKQLDWDDVRPYKVSMTLKSLDEDAAAATKKAVSTGFTNVVNVSETKDDSTRYVEAPNEDPIPGPISITSVMRSTTVGTEFVGQREGVSVTFNGGVCPAGPTKVSVSYTQQSPTTAPIVDTVVNGVLTGGATTVELGSVPNGSTGNVDLAATCIDGGAVVKDARTYTQPVPATNLAVADSATRGLGAHDLSWVKVSSLPTTFDVFWTIGAYTTLPTTADKLLSSTDKLSFQADAKGANVGDSTTYVVVATVDAVKSQPAHATVTTNVPKAPVTSITPVSTGVKWTAVSCPAYTTAQYAERHYTQTGTSTAVNWSAVSAWTTSLEKTGVSTPNYGRTMFEVQSRCVADKTGVGSEPTVSEQKAFYVAQSVTMNVTRSTTLGDIYSGAREGAAVNFAGGVCYGDAKTQIMVQWTPETPSSLVGAKTTLPLEVRTAAWTTVQMDEVPNGATGTFTVNAACVEHSHRVVLSNTKYTQPIPKPILTVKQGANADQHVLSWTSVSSLPTTFSVFKMAAVGYENQDPDFTTALTQTLNYTPGTNYGNLTQYTVSGMVNGGNGVSSLQSITTPWPTVPKAQSIAWTQGAGNSGTLKWSYLGTCPAGTTLKGQQHENRTGQSNGTFDNSVKATSPWTNGPTSYAWKAPYALNGYAYAMGVDSKCVSNVTNLESTKQSVQSPTFVMPMTTPSAPVWDAYNMRDWVRGTNWTYSTCFAGGCPSIVIDYKTYCSAGSSVNWSNFTSTDWNPRSYNHAFGWQDNWHLTAGTRNVTYHNAKYSCATPWATSPQSPAGASVVIQVRA